MAHPYYGTPSGCPAHCTPSAMYMAHPYYVPGTPILWHNLHIHGARKGVLETVAAVKARRRHVSHLVTGPGSRHGLEPAWDMVGADPGLDGSTG